MESSVRILLRFIGATAVISALLFIFNCAFIGFWLDKETYDGVSPNKVVQEVASGLNHSSDSYILNSSTKKLLDENHTWALLMDDSGKVVWHYQLPEEIPKQFTVTEVSKFSKWFLKDYPVFTWEHEDGLVVVGYPKDSFAKYQHILPVRWVSTMPFMILALLIANITLALILSLLIGLRLIRSLRPLTKGIQALGEDKEIYIEPKGILADIAENINAVSKLISQKNASLKARDEARSNWIAGISHDIRTPLSMILGYSSDLEESTELPADKRRKAGVIRRQAEQLRSLVNDLNLVSLLEYEMQPLNKKRIRLSALIRQVATDFLNDGLDERYVLDVEIHNESAQVEGDERLLKRAVTNLIQNSIRHNPEGCHILLQTELQEENHTCRIIVKDDGKGIPDSEIRHLFELPYTSRRKRNLGHGLGLPMVARIAKAHGGKLLLSSDIGKGVEAAILLPAAVDENEN